ncbi:MAG: segregation/condensation protein A [Clostridia bacterium]|nr:segregation/condensation protein A [Clostridia bacterium]
MGVLTLETNKYAIKLENFEGPLDLLCHLVDKNKMDIAKVNISEITDQYIEYLQKMEEEKLEIASEFLVMASTLVYIKSKSLLPNVIEDEAELTEEELVRRIIEYKKYKEISKTLKANFDIFSKRFTRFPETIELPKQVLERKYDSSIIVEKYKSLVERNEQKVNQNAKNIEKIAITETFTVASKVKQIFKELAKKPKFIFNKLFTLNKCSKNEVVTAFSGLLELSRRSKVTATQEVNFGDITVERARK